MKLIESKSDLSKLTTLSEPSIVKFIENQSEHLSKRVCLFVEGRGFHVEGEGGMSRVEGNIFFFQIFF